MRSRSSAAASGSAWSWACSPSSARIISKADPTLTVGTITASVALINRLYRPVESLLNIQVDFTRSLALFTRIFDYFDREIAITSPPDGKCYPMDKDCNIQFSHVSFSYLPEKPLLTDVNFYLPTGKTYAIVGPSGSGKSTLVNLIPRLYDVTGGFVFINGVDVRRYDLTYLRSNVGVVTQETYLFNGTIRDNLLYAKADATQEELDERSSRRPAASPASTTSSCASPTATTPRSATAGSSSPAARSSACPSRA